MRGIIDKGTLYLAMPPLYKIYNKKLIKYAFNEKEKNKIIKEFFNNKNDLLTLTRFKGLGEMPATELRETTMKKEKRKLIKVTTKIGSKETKKTEKIFESLMGKKPELRFKFIKDNANFSGSLDY